MVFHGEIQPEMRAYVSYLTKYRAVPISEICRRLRISRSTADRYRKKTLTLRKRKEQPRVKVGGRPPKLTAQDERKLVRAIHYTVCCFRLFLPLKAIIAMKATTLNEEGGGVTKLFMKLA